jgi:hypothetical protein
VVYVVRVNMRLVVQKVAAVLTLDTLQPVVQQVQRQTKQSVARVVTAATVV